MFKSCFWCFWWTIGDRFIIADFSYTFIRNLSFPPYRLQSRIVKNIFHYLWCLMLVVLQVRLVLPDVTGNEHKSSQVKQRLAGSVVAVEVGGLILAPRSGWLLWSRGWAGWQLLVEGHNLAHSLSVSGATDVLDVSMGNAVGSYAKTNEIRKIRKTIKNLWIYRGVVREGICKFKGSVFHVSENG